MAKPLGRPMLVLSALPDQWRSSLPVGWSPDNSTLCIYKHEARESFPVSWHRRPTSLHMSAVHEIEE